jgi:lipoprotein-anchoring transpeptidase ErfK/SrfK
MVKARRLNVLVATALALTLVLGAAPALAEDGSAPVVVTAHVGVAGTDLQLFGMTQTEAAAAIAGACPTSALAPLPADADGTSFRFDVAAAAACDAAGMAADAIAASADTTLSPSWSEDPAAIAGFVSGVAKKIDRKKVSAKRKIVKSRLKLVKQIDGRTVDTTSATAAVSAAVDAELAAGGSAQPKVTIPVSVQRAKHRTTNIGKTIVVVLHERHVYLYKNAKRQRRYSCAIGMPAHPTPKGLFKVIAKSKHPSWHNPGSAWAKGMPSVIGPGYYNPLGLRALYLNAPGIRIHGTSKTYSMGQAASHGCIRLTNHNVVDIFPLVPVGTPVYIIK